MERLTYWNCKEKGSALPRAINDNGDTVPLEDICAKLAEYEDAEEQGRLVVLPCKVGDTIYFVNRQSKMIDELEVTAIADGISYYYPRVGHYFHERIKFINDIASDTYTTREAAETALKERSAE